MALWQAFQGRPETAVSSDPGAGLIAFSANRDGNKEIIVVNPDGTGMTNLTQHPAGDFEPAWSPDGTSLAFVSSRHAHSDLYVMDLLTRELTQLTQTPRGEFDPNWSPDGTRIATASWNGPPLVVKADGSEPPVTVGPGLQVESGVSWSPDGTRVTFSAALPTSEDLEQDIYVAMADGSGFENLTDDDREQLDPRWSPGGEWIAFLDGVDNKDGGLVAIRPDGSQLRSLLGKEAGLGPEWSPDGRRLAVGWDTLWGKSGVATVDADGSNLRVLAHLLYARVLDWAPDGSGFVFEASSESNGDGGVFVVDADGSGLRRISGIAPPGASPDWGAPGAVPLPGPTGSPGATPEPGPTASTSPPPTSSPIPPDQYPPIGAFISGRGGSQEGVAEPFCWVRRDPETGRRTRDCRDDGGWEPENALPMVDGETIRISIAIGASPSQETLTLESPGDTREIELTPSNVNTFTVDLPEGLWHATLCGTWPGHGAVCWRFLLAVAE